MQTYKVAELSPDSDKVPGGTAGAEGSMSKPVDGWPPPKAVPRHAASGPALRSTNYLTPGRPVRNGEYGRRRQGSWLTGRRRHPPPGRTPWLSGPAFRPQVPGQAPRRSNPGTF